MSITYHFDLYPRANPVSGTLVRRLVDLQEAEYRGEANGTGSGKIVLRGNSADAAFIDPKGMQYIRVVRDDGATEVVVGGFFLENGEYEALTERSTKKLSFGGAGTLSYLDRAIAAEETYIAGSEGPFDDTWHWYYSPAGGILHRMVFEALDADRPQDPIAGVTLNFFEDLDSDGNPWPGYGTSWYFTAAVSEGLLSIVRRLMQAGVYVSMHPDTFELSAWMANTHGRDRTGVAWGTNVLRFQAPSAATVATGNIKSDAKRSITALIKRSAILIGANNIWNWVTGSSDIVWEGGYRNDDPSAGSSTAIAEAQLQARDDAGDTVRLRIKLGNAPTTGEYLPFEHILLDDLVTLHTGTGQWDWNEISAKVAAITLKLRQGGDWDAWVDLGSKYSSIESRQFQVPGVGGGSCTCPQPAPYCQSDLGNTVIVDNDDAAWGDADSTGLDCGMVDMHRIGPSGGTKGPFTVSPNTSYSIPLIYEGNGYTAILTVKFYDASNNFISSEELLHGVYTGCPTLTLAFTTPPLTDHITLSFHSKLAGWKFKISIEEVGTAVANSPYCVPIGDAGTSPVWMRSDDQRVLRLITQMADLAEIIGFSWKRSVRAATTAAGTLASDFEDGDIIDGVTLVAGERILIQDQAAGEENGIYLVQASGAPVRTADFDADEDVLGAVVLVQEGTANADKLFRCTNDDPIVLGTDALVFAELSGGGGGGHTIKEDGTPLTARTGLNFGSGLLATDDVGNDETDVVFDPTVLTGAIEVVIGYVGANLATGIYGDFEIPFGLTLTAWRLFADQSGAIKIDVWKDTYANFPPTDADSITNANEPEITASGVKAEDTTITNWVGEACVAGEILRFNIDSVTSIQRVTLSLRFTRN